MELLLGTSLGVQRLEVGFWPLNHASCCCLVMAALSIVAPVVAGGLGPAAPYGVNAL